MAKGDEALESLEVGGESMYVFGRSLTCDTIEHPSASRQRAALIHHANGSLYAVDLKSSHRTFVDGKPIKPHEATRIRDGAVLTFGASTRTYTLRGARAEAAAAAGSSRAEAASSSAAPARSCVCGDGGGDRRRRGRRRRRRGEGGAGKKKKSKQYWDEHKKERKRQRILGGGKKQMTENERVSMSAGAGTGCMGPGEPKLILDAVAPRTPIAAHAVPSGPLAGRVGRRRRHPVGVRRHLRCVRVGEAPEDARDAVVIGHVRAIAAGVERVRLRRVGRNVEEERHARPEDPATAAHPARCTRANTLCGRRSAPPTAAYA